MIAALAKLALAFMALLSHPVVSHTAAAVAPKPAVVVPYCARAEAYISTHDKPGTLIDCPVTFPVGIVSSTRLVDQPQGGSRVTISVSTRACFIAWEDEASNSFYDFQDSPPPSNYTSAGVDVNGRHVDPFGEC